MNRTIEPMRRKDRPKGKNPDRAAQKRAALAKRAARKRKGSAG